ncbi:MAG: hypothetical protein KF685_11570 [Acidobacteria bacterium]|nr:hypothetical protein [Acidobacteriota bacterium]
MRHVNIACVVLIFLAVPTAFGQLSDPEKDINTLKTELAALLQKNGSYSWRNQNTRLTDVSFEGCRISFQTELEIAMERGAMPSTDPRAGLSRDLMPADSKILTEYAFDLAEINPSEIDHRMDVGGNIRLLLKTIDNDEILSYKMTFSDGRVSDRKASVIALSIRKKAANDVKAGLISLLRRCQE